MKKAKKLCKKNCLGRIINKDKGIYCHHIESKLPKPSKQSVKAYPSKRIETYSEVLFKPMKVISEKEIEVKLKNFGLGQYEIELLMLRYIENKPMADIVTEQGWVGVNSASYYLRTALEKLRKGRFKFR